MEGLRAFVTRWMLSKLRRVFKQLYRVMNVSQEKDVNLGPIQFGLAYCVIYSSYALLGACWVRYPHEGLCRFETSK